MNYLEQKKLGRKLFPELKEFIMEENTCFDDILDEINKQKPLRERFLTLKSIPEEWAIEWALSIGDLDIMLNHVTEVSWESSFNTDGLESWDDEDDNIVVEWFN